jgi:SAM-dependent methyltransferase
MLPPDHESLRHDTLAYYERHAAAFVESTQRVSLAETRSTFLEHLPTGGSILDAGCGSGRDTRVFRNLGYRATAFDGSPEVARLAEGVAGTPVLVLDFSQIEWVEEFDGIWACAALLHLPETPLRHALHRLTRALKTGGVLYASFRYGEIEYQLEDGRFFRDLNETRLDTLLHNEPALSKLGHWLTADTRPDHAGECWFNCLLQKRGA